MRRPSLFALLLLAACAAPGSPGVDPEWNEVQRHRLERLRAERRPADAVVALLGRAPRDLTQDPKPATAERERPHIDQIRPAVAGAGPRPFRAPNGPLVASVEAGVGDVMVRSSGTRLDDRADAAFVRAAIESGAGVGVQAELWSSDDDLFAGTMINDGVAPIAADATLRGFSVFPFLRHDLVRGDRFSLPVRLGLFLDWQQIDPERGGLEREWLALGPRLQLEPTLRLLGEEGGDRLDLVGRIGGDVGPAWFRESFRGGDDRDTAPRWSGELGASLRGHVGRMHAELGYGLHHTTVGELDGELLGNPSRTELQRQRAFFGFGLRF